MQAPYAASDASQKIVSGTYSSQPAFCNHNSCIIILARMTIGEIRPSGSNMRATLDRMDRFVGMDKSLDIADSKDKTSCSGSHETPRAFTVSCGKNCRADCVPI
ncbi:uncharacterized protein LOC120908641 [Anopheles arabiensis]|uniref:uncharacterized protein LOC120908641 n=1 Tax=Anopheles arabiensis TaxID=7173 RepID=UPI001AADA1ED|nr:uncharacterized protein LOC120908641 [Anopheles arabiensis]